jgi:Fe-S cluster assembly iron-binding protein IscA
VSAEGLGEFPFSDRRGCAVGAGYARSRREKVRGYRPGWSLSRFRLQLPRLGLGHLSCCNIYRQPRVNPTSKCLFRVRYALAWPLRAAGRVEDEMLQLTNEAVTIIKEERARLGAPPDACLRLRTTSRDGGRLAVQLGFVIDPEPGDQVVEHPDLRVFVSPDLTYVLADCTLDAEATREGLELTLR